MAVTTWTAGQVLAAADLNDTFASKLPYSYGTATPSTTVEGFLWFDENFTPPIAKVWNGTAFVAFSQGPADFSDAATGTYTDTGISYKYITFTASGTLTVTRAGLADVLIVSGGAGGGGSNGGNQGGGGGAGGYLYIPQIFMTATSHTVTVGAGGAGGANPGGTGSNGGTSSVTINGVLYACRADGGGVIGSATGNNGLRAGVAASEGVVAGGGGGGGAAGGSGFPPSGNNGAGGSGGAAGGGGGAGGAGVAAGSGGAGGAGRANSITGTSITRAAGGAANSAVNGAANSGNGGGGGNVTAGGPGFAGGSGVVIVRVKG